MAAPGAPLIGVGVGYAVELVLDEDGAGAIDRLRDALVKAGVPALAAEIGDVPHVSLAVLDDEVPVTELSDAVEGFAAEVPPFGLTFTSLGLFPPGGWVLFAAPKPDARLIEFHEAMLARLGGHTQHLHDLYRPEWWVPHATIEMEIDREHLADAVLAATEAFEPFDAQIGSVAVVAFRPVDVLATFPLTG